MRFPFLALMLAGFASFVAPAAADDLPEYRLKAAFLFNFARYTEWPAETGATLNLCILGQDPFGAEIDALQGKKVVGRSVAVVRLTGREPLAGCQLLFIASSAMPGLPRVLEELRGTQVLTVTDSSDSRRNGVALNMLLEESRVSFEVNPKALGARLTLSSKLLRLAKEIHQ